MIDDFLWATYHIYRRGKNWKKKTKNVAQKRVEVIGTPTFQGKIQLHFLFLWQKQLCCVKLDIIVISIYQFSPMFRHIIY